MAYTPFKMKGNPMKRNFGIGAAPVKMKKSAAKMMDESPAKKYKSDAQRKAVHASKAEQSPAKMMKKSPAKKPLVGKQKNLPEELKKKILASPSKMKKESAMKMKKEPGRGGAKLMNKAKLAKIQKRQEEEKMIKGVEKTRAKELARKRKPKPGGALKMKKKK